MDELLKLSSTDILSSFTIWEAVMSFGMSFILALVLGLFYRITHQGTSYSQGYVHTMVVMCFTVAIIMLIIGSNIARAFSLVGALSIIRFRNAVKETRDVGFIFLAMAIGMACGTRFYLLATVFTGFACAAIYFMYRFEVGKMVNPEMMLKVYLPSGESLDDAFSKEFVDFTTGSRLIAVESVGQGMFNELTYTIEFKKNASTNDFITAIRHRNGGAKVQLVTGLQNTNV